jgi:hypothetical protein
MLFKTTTLAVTTVLLIAGSAKAEIRNESRWEEQLTSCVQYDNFLAGREVAANQDCHPLETLIIESEGLSVLGLSDRLIARTFEGSAFHALAQTLRSTVSGDAISSLQWANQAQTRIAIQMTVSGDMERAHLYSHLIQDIERLGIVAACDKNAGCEQLVQTEVVSDILGQEFVHLDQHRSDLFFGCLLRTDAYSVPVRSIVKSRKFAGCLDTRS